MRGSRLLTLGVVILALPVFGREVKVSFYDYQPLHEIKADGSYSGLGYDTFELLAKKAGWENRYVGEGKPWSEMEKMLESGEVEILDCVRKLPEREKIFEFSSQPAGYSCGYILVRQNDGRFVDGDYANWGRVRAGALIGASVTAEFKEFAELHGVRLDYHGFRTDKKTLAALKAGEIDMAIIESTATFDMKAFRVLSQFSPKPYYFCVKKGNTALIAEIDRAMSAVYQENPAWYIDLHHKYYPVRDVVVYLPRSHEGDEVLMRYMRVSADLLAAIGNWNPVFRECSEDFSDADFSVPCIVGHVHRTPENLKKFDFPFAPVCRRPVYLACDPNDARFKRGVSATVHQTYRIGYDLNHHAWLKCFLDYASEHHIAYTLMPFETTAELRAAVQSSQVDLAVLGINPGGPLKSVESCGHAEFDFVTPKEQPAMYTMLDMSTRYMRYHEGAFLRKLEKYAYGIEDSSRTVRAGVYAEFGGTELRADGTFGGFVIEYLREVARVKNWDLIFVPMTYGVAMNCLATGEIDIAAASGPYPETSTLYDHSRRDAGVVRYALKVRTNSAIMPNRPETWTGNRIGYLAGTKPVEELRHYLDGIKAKYQLIPYARLPDAMADIESGKLDGYYTIHADESQGFRTVAVFPLVHVFFCTSKKRPDVKADLDSAMDYFAAQNMDFNWWLSNYYLKSNRETLMLDPEEIRYVENLRGRKVTIGFPESVLPVINFNEKTKEASGFLANLFRLISKKAGIEFEFVGKGDADVYVIQRDSREWKDGLVTYRSWFPLPTVRLSLPEDEIPDSARGIWAVEAKRVDEINYLRSRNLTPLIVNSREDCYKAVARGEAEATIDNAGTARLMIDEHREFRKLRDTRINPKEWARQVGLVFPTYGDPELRRIFKRARTSIADTTVEKLFMDALIASRKGRFNVDDVILYGSIIAIVVLFVFLIVLVNSDRRIRRKNLEKERADAANKAKTSFLFNMSHDIRTPMNAIMGFTDIALKSLDDKARLEDALKKTKESGGLLLALINSILDMSRIEAGKAHLEESPGDVKFSFANLQATMMELARARDISLTFEFGKIKDYYVYADFDRCARIFVNLISNAIKYTKSGGWVRVKCEQFFGKSKVLSSRLKSRVEERNNHSSTSTNNFNSSTANHESRTTEYGIYRFTIADNGIGMSEEFQKHVFEQFTRERNSTTSGIQGTGLGLALCKSLTELMGGTIECSSRQGEGTTFTVTLPFRLQDGESYTDPMTGREIHSSMLKSKVEERNVHSSTSTQNFNFKGMRVLLVEDNELNREVAEYILKEQGFEVDCAADGSVAVRMYKESVDSSSKLKSKVEERNIHSSTSTPNFNSSTTDHGPRTTTYDYILMDIQMPIMGGYEATAAIRDAGYKGPIIALSANAFAEDREASIKAGMNDHVAKPIKVDELVEVLSRYKTRDTWGKSGE